jgi:endonuclease/exonuclease/phosphatase family metal-dependent hydrolase
MRTLLLIALATVFCGCHSTRIAREPDGPQVRVLTYNINWGGGGAALAAQAIRDSGADIVCLQETTPEWEQFLRRTLARDYPFMEFRQSQGRMGGGLGFLTKLPAREIAYVPSDTGWFDGWITKFETPLGPVQVINIHLRPPVSDSGSFVSGYFTTGDDRLREMERFYAQREPALPTVVMGDFNDGEKSSVVRWLEGKEFTNALPQFDRRSPTWQWQTSVVTLRRRMDHILYSREFDCASARVMRTGASDHFPVAATMTRHERK